MFGWISRLGLEIQMFSKTQPDWFVKEVQARSYSVWEREGRKEIVDEFRAAAAGTNAHFTPPHLVVSQRPTRH
jgi:hypothetical protein